MLNKLIVPLSIIIAGGLIALAIFVSLSNEGGDKGISASALDHDPSEVIGLIDDLGVNGKILGDLNAPITITEYSDTECPFCQRYHHSLKEIMQTHGRAGTVAWEFKHFPLVQLHRKAFKESQALECINELGGDRAFWIGLDTIFTITPGNDRLNHNLLPAIAELAEVDRDEFNLCLEEDRHRDIVEAEMNEAVALGGTGTPFSVVNLKTALTQDQYDRLESFDAQVSETDDVFVIAEDRMSFAMSGAMSPALINEFVNIITGPGETATE